MKKLKVILATLMVAFLLIPIGTVSAVADKKNLMEWLLLNQ